MDDSERLRRLAAREEIEQLKYRYCHGINTTDMEGLVSLFTEDARFETPATAQDDYSHDFPADAAVGHDDLRVVFGRIFDEFESTAHLVVNPLVEIEGDEAAGGWYYLVVLDDGEQVEWAQGRYEDEYRRVDGEWKIASSIVRRHAAISTPSG